MKTIGGAHNKSVLVKKVFEIVALLLTVALFVLKVVICLVIWWGNPSLLRIDVSLPDALKNATYKLTIAPSEWVHAMWPFLFLWEITWILFAWSFTCRKAKHRTIFAGVYPAYWFVCLLNIGWGLSWGKVFPELGLAFGALQSFTLILCVAMLSVNLYFITNDLKYTGFKTSLMITRILVLNVFAAYTTWSVVHTLYNLGSVLQHNAQLHPDTTSTVILSLLGSIAVTYFLLECTILDWFLRSVIVVYPVVVWSLAGVLVENWNGGGGDRNKIFSLALVCVCGALFLIRVLLIGVFSIVRPLAEYEKEGEEKLPS